MESETLTLKLAEVIVKWVWPNPLAASQAEPDRYKFACCERPHVYHPITLVGLFTVHLQPDP